MTVHVNWRDDAACRDADPELFFPVGTAGPALRQIREARRICCGCPALAPCLAWALHHGVTDGVWGGTTEEQRRALRSLARARPNGQEHDVHARPGAVATRVAEPYRRAAGSS
jgi:WhiB family transcriptional regulator, redox-sensing transcriptional regulator